MMLGFPIFSLLFCCAVAEFVNITGNATVSSGDESPFSKMLDRLTSGPQEWNLGTMRNAYVMLCPEAETWEACKENFIVVDLAELVKQVRDLQQAVKK
jgi:hypothetical protein